MPPKHCLFLPFKRSQSGLQQFMDESKQRIITLATLRYFQPTSTSSLHCGASSLKAKSEQKHPSRFTPGKIGAFCHRRMRTFLQRSRVSWWTQSGFLDVGTQAPEEKIRFQRFHHILYCYRSEGLEIKSLKQQASSRNLFSFPLARGKFRTL